MASLMDWRNTMSLWLEGQYMVVVEMAQVHHTDDKVPGTTLGRILCMTLLTCNHEVVQHTLQDTWLSAWMTVSSLYTSHMQYNQAESHIDLVQVVAEVFWKQIKRMKKKTQHILCVSQNYFNQPCEILFSYIFKHVCITGVIFMMVISHVQGSRY